MNYELAVVAQEMISRARNSKILDSTAESCYRAMQGDPLSAKSKRDLSKVLSDIFNLDITVDVIESPTKALEVDVLNVKKNHVLFGKQYRESVSGSDYIRLISTSDFRDYRSIVDRENYRITGALSTIPHRIRITSGCFDGAMGKYLIAAGLLHEVGHIFTFCEFIADMTITSYTLSELSRLYKSSQDDIRTRMIDETSNLLEINSDRLAKALADGEDLLTVVAESRVVDSVDLTGSYMYSSKSAERLADQFVSRLGGQVYLVQALNIIYQDMGEPAYWHGFFHYMLNAIVFLYLIGTVSVLALFFILTSDPAGAVYDKPNMRFKKIRNEIARDLANASPKDKAYIREKLNAFDEVTKVMSNVTDRTNVGEILHYLVSGDYRAQKRQYDKLNQLEDLAANDLFVKFHKLRGN